MNIKKLIDEKDFQEIEKIANKYNMTVIELGKLLTIQNDNKPFYKQIRLTEEELTNIDEKAKNFGITRNEYIIRCQIKAIKNNEQLNLDIRKINKKTYAGPVSKNKENIRNRQVNVYFKDLELYENIRITAKKLSVKVSSLIREWSLTINL